MLSTLLKIPYLRLKYRFLPNQAQGFWAQELLDSQGLGAKLGQILSQGKKPRLPKSSLSSAEAKLLFKTAFQQDIQLQDEVLAASMGQVFYTRDQKVAVKILHPGIRERLKKEIDNVLLLGGYFSRAKGFSFDKTVFRRFLEEVFEQETDLRREAHFQEKFGEIVSRDPRFKVPAVIRETSNDNILSQELVHCTLAQDAKDLPNFAIFDFFFHSLLNHGILHGDLNDRNWGVAPDQRIVIYDYGCSQIISERRTTGLKKLLLNQDVAQGFKEFGVRLTATSFHQKEQELRDALFAPLLEGSVSSTLRYSEELQKKYGDRIKELREFTDPWVLLMMRSLFSLIRIYQERGQEIPLQKILSPYLHLKEHSTKSTKIHIEVTEGTELIVSLRVPISNLGDLETLMPGTVTAKVKAEGIKISHLINQVKDSDYAPQDLFQLKLGTRAYRVWID